MDSEMKKKVAGAIGLNMKVLGELLPKVQVSKDPKVIAVFKRCAELTGLAKTAYGKDKRYCSHLHRKTIT
jgi:hypothetical protein